MQRILENLRARPTHERRRISLQVAGGIIAVVFLVWVSTLGVRLAGSVDANVQNTASNSSSFVAAVAAAGSAVKEQVNRASAVISSAGSGDVTWSDTETPQMVGGSEQATVLSTTTSER